MRTNLCVTVDGGSRELKLETGDTLLAKTWMRSRHYKGVEPLFRAATVMSCSITVTWHYKNVLYEAKIINQ